jgi:hypothetical protein
MIAQTMEIENMDSVDFILRVAAMLGLLLALVLWCFV